MSDSGSPTFFLEKVVRTRFDEPEDFTGPLELILLLLSKNKLEIRDIRIAEHANFDSRRRHIIENRLNLSAHHSGARRLYCSDLPRVLRSERGDGAARMDPMSCRGLDVDLSAGPSTAVRAGNYEN